MQHSDGRFPGAGGLELYYQRWLPDSPPRAAVVLVHGVGEHSGRYMNVVGPLVEAGYAAHSYDHRGHGRSRGPRVHIERWAEYRDDLGAYLAVVSQEANGRPIVIYGHSMGSLVVLDYLLQSSTGLHGAIISGVATQPVGVGSPAAIAAAKVLSGIVPRLSVSLGIEDSALSRDPEALEAYHADPLCTGRATVRWGAESLKTVDLVKEGSNRVDLPLLVLHGEADALNSVEGARALYAAVSHPDKTLRVYPDVCHEPHNDVGHERVAADIIEWLARLIGPTD